MFAPWLPLWKIGVLHDLQTYLRDGGPKLKPFARGTCQTSRVSHNQKQVFRRDTPANVLFFWGGSPMLSWGPPKRPKNGSSLSFPLPPHKKRATEPRKSHRRINQYLQLVPPNQPDTAVSHTHMRVFLKVGFPYLRGFLVALLKNKTPNMGIPAKKEEETKYIIKVSHA